jgi:hypothetical protein
MFAAPQAPVYMQAPTSGYAAAAVSPMYMQPAAPQPAVASYGGYAAAEAMPVSAAPQVASVTVQQPSVVIQLVVPQNAVPGSVLNATLSDGRVVRIFVRWFVTNLVLMNQTCCLGRLRSLSLKMSSRARRSRSRCLPSENGTHMTDHVRRKTSFCLHLFHLHSSACIFSTVTAFLAASPAS